MTAHQLSCTRSEGEILRLAGSEMCVGFSFSSAVQASQVDAFVALGTESMSVCEAVD